MIASEPEAGSIIANTARGLLRSFIPGKKSRAEHHGGPRKKR